MVEKKEYNWPIDPSVVDKQPRGAPIDGHPGRCQGAKWKTDPPTQCKYWAVKGSRYCVAHNGRVKGRGKAYMRRNRYAVSPRLVKRFEEFAAESPESRHSLQDEIDAARMLAEDAFKTLDKVYSKEDSSQKLRSLAMAHCKDSIGFVSDVVSKAAKVRSLSERTFDFEVIDAVLCQVFKVIQEEVEWRDSKLYETLVSCINKIELPSRQSAGALSPEQTAEQIRDALSMMRQSIPKPDANGHPISNGNGNGHP